MKGGGKRQNVPAFCFSLNAISSSSSSFFPFLGALRGFALPPRRDLIVNVWILHGTTARRKRWIASAHLLCFDRPFCGWLIGTGLAVKIIWSLCLFVSSKIYYIWTWWLEISLKMKRRKGEEKLNKCLPSSRPAGSERKASIVPCHGLYSLVPIRLGTESSLRLTY